jgi:hypothetical protein
LDLYRKQVYRCVLIGASLFFSSFLCAYFSYIHTVLCVRPRSAPTPQRCAPSTHALTCGWAFSLSRALHCAGGPSSRCFPAWSVWCALLRFAARWRRPRLRALRSPARGGPRHSSLRVGSFICCALWRHQLGAAPRRGQVAPRYSPSCGSAVLRCCWAPRALPAPPAQRPATTAWALWSLWRRRAR